MIIQLNGSQKQKPTIAQFDLENTAVKFSTYMSVNSGNILEHFISVEHHLVHVSDSDSDIGHCGKTSAEDFIQNSIAQKTMCKDIELVQLSWTSML